MERDLIAAISITRYLLAGMPGASVAVAVAYN